MNGDRRTRARSALAGALVIATLKIACSGGSASTADGGPPPTNGSLVVFWKLLGTDGSTLTCDQLSFDEVSVAIGGTPKFVACSQGMTSFTDLLPDQYPISVAFLTGGSTMAMSYGNAHVRAGMETDYTAVLHSDQHSFNTGSLITQWTVENVKAMSGCGILGGATVRLTSGPGSIQSFTATTGCVNGSYTLNALQSGTYDVIMNLLDDKGLSVSTTGLTMITIVAAHTLTATVDFEPPGTNNSVLLGKWTVHGQSAASQCARDGGEKVTIYTINSPGQVELSTTTPCSHGMAELRQLPFGEYDIGIRMSNSLAGAIATSTFSNVILRAARTTTITADLKP
jgi:hypothetical protein